MSHIVGERAVLAVSTCIEKGTSTVLDNQLGIQNMTTVETLLNKVVLVCTKKTASLPKCAQITLPSPNLCGSI